MGAKPKASILHDDGTVHDASRGTALLTADLAGVTLVNK